MKAWELAVGNPDDVRCLETDRRLAEQPRPLLRSVSYTQFTNAGVAKSRVSARADSYVEGVNYPQTKGIPRIPRHGILSCGGFSLRELAVLQPVSQQPLSDPRL